MVDAPLQNSSLEKTEPLPEHGVNENAFDLIPHSPPMLMIEKIISMNDSRKSSISMATIVDDNPFVDNNDNLIPSAYLELIAQAAAAQHGFNLRRDGSIEEEGFLVGVRNLNIIAKAAVGDVLAIEVQVGTEIDNLSMVSGSVRKDDELLATADITVWHGSDLN